MDLKLLLENIRRYVFYSIIISVIIIPLIYLTSLENGIKISIIILFFFIGITSIFSFDLLYFFLIVSVLLPPMMVLHQAVLISILAFVGLFINYKNLSYAEIKNPLLSNLILFLIPIFISYINISSLIPSSIDLINYFGLLCSFIATLFYVKKRKTIEIILTFFVFVVLLHSIYVIFEGITTGQRVFGILGVYYIDYAGLASLMSFILIIYSRNYLKVFYLFVFIITTLGLMLTQTRNAWLSTGFALGTLIVYLIIKGDNYFVKRRVLISFSLIGIIISSILIFSTGIKINERSDTKNQTLILTDDPNSSNVNSYFTRLLIWHTAFNGFTKHPFVGIGAYSFKHSSDLYYTIPKAFYKLYVKGKTPHVAYIQVPTETGILGFIVFIAFIIKIIKLIYLTKASSKSDVKIVLLITWSLIYIVFSMAMTESWLYGQYTVWFGILLGMLININKIMVNEKIS